MRVLVVTCFTAVLLATPIASQESVISVIKPNRSGGTGAMLGVPSGTRWSASNVTVLSLMAAAYGDVLPLRDEQVIGAPPWTRSERFDVVARIEGPPFAEEPEGDAAIVRAFELVRVILAERFRLRVHEESRPGPTYRLVRVVGRSKPLAPANIDCDEILRRGPYAEVLGKNGRRLAPCGVRTRVGQIVGSGATMHQLAQYLGRVPGVDREVVDATGLTGRYDFTVEWTPPQVPQSDASGVAPPAETGPSIFTALQDQLGLKLEAQRTPVRVIVIDHIERPTPN